MFAGGQGQGLISSATRLPINQQLGDGRCGDELHVGELGFEGYGELLTRSRCEANAARGWQITFSEQMQAVACAGRDRDEQGCAADKNVIQSDTRSCRR